MWIQSSGCCYCSVVSFCRWTWLWLRICNKTHGEGWT